MTNKTIETVYFQLLHDLEKHKEGDVCVKIIIPECWTLKGHRITSISQWHWLKLNEDGYVKTINGRSDYNPTTYPNSFRELIHDPNCKPPELFKEEDNMQDEDFEKNEWGNVQDEDFQEFQDAPKLLENEELPDHEELKKPKGKKKPSTTKKEGGNSKKKQKK